MPVLESSVLDRKVHARLMADSVNVCSVAGVQIRYLHESMSQHCGPVELDWVRRFRLYESSGVPGLLLCGSPNPDQRCQAIGAALVRNYIDARVMPLNTVLETVEKGGDMTQPHVLLIPNLYVSARGVALPAWKVQILYDVLLSRAVQSRSSVVYIESLEGLVTAYGKPLADHLNTYRQVAA